MARLAASTALAIGVIILLAMPAHALSYNFTPLPTLSGVTVFPATGINDKGDIAGPRGDGYSFLYSSGNYTTLDIPGAAGINDNEVVVGNYFGSDGISHGYQYSGGGLTAIDDPSAGKGFSQGTSATGVNNKGDIVGYYRDGNNHSHGFEYSSGKFTTIDDPECPAGTNPQGINDNGDIVGYCYNNNSQELGFLYRGGTFTTLADPSAPQNTYPYGINGNGDIVGYYLDSSGYRVGFVYSGGLYTTINYPGERNTWVYGINDSGEIVGDYADSDLLQHGFFATLSGSLWQDAMSTGGGWYYLSPFGAFNTNNSPWIYHQTLGWLYPTGMSTDSIWFYDPQWDGTGGWWWTGSSFFPWVYSATEDEWLYYDAGDSSLTTRWFINTGGQASVH